MTRADAAKKSNAGNLLRSSGMIDSVGRRRIVLHLNRYEMLRLRKQQAMADRLAIPHLR